MTVVPFYEKPDETDGEKTKVVIPAEVNGFHSVFILDLGSVVTALNRNFLQPNASGGVDSVTDANRKEDHTPRTGSLSKSHIKEWDIVRVSFRIGTLPVEYDDTLLTKVIGEQDPHRYNAVLGHFFGDFSWVFSPRLGNIGPRVLEQFETIIDYPRRRVVLIRLDGAGRRMVDVPVYTPKWTAPLLPKSGLWGIKVGPNNVLDTLKSANNTQLFILDTGAPYSTDDLLGYDFLSKLGVFGINQRTHQFFLYR